MKGLHVVAFLLVIVGALNWGLVGLFNLNLVELVLGGFGMWLVRLVYILVGLSAVYLIVKHKDECMVCSGKTK